MGRQRPLFDDQRYRPARLWLGRCLHNRRGTFASCHTENLRILMRRRAVDSFFVRMQQPLIDLIRVGENGLTRAARNAGDGQALVFLPPPHGAQTPPEVLANLFPRVQPAGADKLSELVKSFGEGRGKPGQEKLGGERPIEVTGKLVLESPAVTPARTLPSSNVT